MVPVALRHSVRVYRYGRWHVEAPCPWGSPAHVQWTAPEPFGSNMRRSAALEFALLQMRNALARFEVPHG